MIWIILPGFVCFFLVLFIQTYREGRVFPSHNPGEEFFVKFLTDSFILKDFKWWLPVQDFFSMKNYWLIRVGLEVLGFNGFNFWLENCRNIIQFGNNSRKA